MVEGQQYRTTRESRSAGQNRMGRSIRERLGFLLLPMIGDQDPLHRSGLSLAERLLLSLGPDAWPALLNGLETSRNNSLYGTIGKITNLLMESAERLFAKGEKKAIPYLVELISQFRGDETDVGDYSGRRRECSRLISSLARLGGREAILAMLDLLEDPSILMKRTIAFEIALWRLEDGAFTPNVERSVAHTAEQLRDSGELNAAGDLLTALTRHGTPEAQRVLRRSLSDGDPHLAHESLKALAQATWLDSTWLADLTSVPIESRGPESERNICSAMAGIPDSRSAEYLLQRFNPRCSDSAATDGLARLAKGPRFH